MKFSQFISSITDYWAKNGLEENAGVMRSIAEEIRTAPEAALKIILHWLKQTIQPNRLIGVADIYAAAQATGSALHRRTGKSWDVECPVCAMAYSYAQGIRDECPRCAFPYITHINALEYNKQSGHLPASIRAAYGREKERAHVRLEQMGVKIGSS